MPTYFTCSGRDLELRQQVDQSDFWGHRTRARTAWPVSQTM